MKKPDDVLQQFSNIWRKADTRQKRLIAELANRPEAWQGRTPPCPYQKIVELYHETLPMLRKVRLWTSTRQGHLRQRWQQMPDLAEWRAYFHMVSRSQFLTGKSGGWDGRAFEADFDWLIKEANFAKVLEGKYR